jgi:heptosyltransferase II
VSDPRRILVLHTAFPGDIVLTVPLLETIHARYPAAFISTVVAPGAAGLLQHHPAIHELIVYDKRGTQRGASGILNLAARLRRNRFDLAIVPHRSLRSAVIPWLARIPRRIGFSTSAGRVLYTDVVEYVRGIQEIDRNLRLLAPLGIAASPGLLPTLHPDAADRAVVDRILEEWSRRSGPRLPAGMVALAPGSVWETKRWPAGHYATLGRQLIDNGLSVVLIGGGEDKGLADAVAADIRDPAVLNAAGSLTLLQSAELIRRCLLLVSNDSAPVHIGVAMRTPVIAIFGPTVPAFGFAPRGPRDEVVQREGLSCRPCSIHGSRSCPIKTFVCMKEILPGDVTARVLARIHTSPAEA